MFLSSHCGVCIKEPVLEACIHNSGILRELLQLRHVTVRRLSEQLPEARHQAPSRVNVFRQRHYPKGT